MDNQRLLLYADDDIGRYRPQGVWWKGRGRALKWRFIGVAGRRRIGIRMSILGRLAPTPCRLGEKTKRLRREAWRRRDARQRRIRDDRRLIGRVAVGIRVIAGEKRRGVVHCDLRDTADNSSARAIIGFGCLRIRLNSIGLCSGLTALG